MPAPCANSTLEGLALLVSKVTVGLCLRLWLMLLVFIPGTLDVQRPTQKSSYLVLPGSCLGLQPSGQHIALWT